MSWQDRWAEEIGEQPADRTSREVSVQEVLAGLVAGRKCDWFVPYRPTSRGVAFLSELWRVGFGDAGRVEWFVSEYEMPVPTAWRAEIPFTYRCPDFACGNEDRVLIIELKTERGSYQASQIADYLRLARHLLPDAVTDVALLAPHRPGAHPACDSRQRYTEIIWNDVPPLLEASFPNDGLAEGLARFLAADLAVAEEAQMHATPALVEPPESESFDELTESAVLHALRLAPSVADSRPGDRTERGLDVAFATTREARAAQAAVKQALASSGYGERVTVWLWQPSSTGYPTTTAGDATGRELRLAPMRQG